MQYTFCVAQSKLVWHPVLCMYIYMDGSGGSRAEHIWLEYLPCREGIDIQHIHNRRRVKIGKYGMWVDWFSALNKTNYEFFGCHWHGHQCQQTHDSGQQCQRYQHTRSKPEYFVVLTTELRVGTWNIHTQLLQLGRPGTDVWPLQPLGGYHHPQYSRHSQNTGKKTILVGLSQTRFSDFNP